MGLIITGFAYTTRAGRAMQPFQAGMDDPGYGRQDIDLVFKRSTDNGATWAADDAVSGIASLSQTMLKLQRGWMHY